ncbi:TolC family protein [Mucilaginibacter limnophilus]|uniref:TolC family protein n=1 Tax=Mucilaginibacter limnophilus TaxID=1932778 RepID=A0A437MTS2_9SPHI|nr:TolC family protein [Mucilaginibacter limnophilus]RVU01058.1 TolC family protein [Mucilaginibacter limnophilus]
MKKHILIILCLTLPVTIFAQTTADTLKGNLTLRQCIDFALKNQPAVKQAAIDEEINERDIRIGLSGWLPQVNGTGTVQHYFKGGPVAGAANIPGGVTTDIRNLSNLGVQATQTLYNNDVFLASRTARFSRQYYRQNSQLNRIDVVSEVSKAFFDVLLSQRQLSITNEDITRLQRSLKDARSRYEAGVTDKIDFKQATIALNNAMVTRKQTTEAIKSREAYLKQIMGVNANTNLSLQYDSARYVAEATIDTNQILDVTKRIEYQQLLTTKSLQNLNVSYYKWGFLPSLSAVGAYNLIYANSSLSNLYDNTFPNGYVGLSLSIPIFQGTRRIQNLRKARLQEERVDQDIINVKNVINTEYVQAMANYKSNYTAWVLTKQNMELAQDVFNVVSLQYREGIKVYLDVIVAQTDLRTAQLNYYNALFQLLSSRIDVERASGTLAVQ